MEHMLLSKAYVTLFLLQTYYCCIQARKQTILKRDETHTYLQKLFYCLHRKLWSHSGHQFKAVMKNNKKNNCAPRFVFTYLPLAYI